MDKDLVPIELTPLVLKKKRPIRLKSARDCRKFLGRLANQVYRQELNGVDAGRIAYVLSIWLKSLEIDELQQKLVEIEDRLARGNR